MKLCVPSSPSLALGFHSVSRPITPSRTFQPFQIKLGFILYNGVVQTRNRTEADIITLVFSYQMKEARQMLTRMEMRSPKLIYCVWNGNMCTKFEWHWGSPKSLEFILCMGDHECVHTISSSICCITSKNVLISKKDFFSQSLFVGNFYKKL